MWACSAGAAALAIKIRSGGLQFGGMAFGLLMEPFAIRQAELNRVALEPLPQKLLRDGQ